MLKDRGKDKTNTKNYIDRKGLKVKSPNVKGLSHKIFVWVKAWLRRGN
jgi:hypothetical protein